MSAGHTVDDMYEACKILDAYPELAHTVIERKRERERERDRERKTGRFLF